LPHRERVTDNLLEVDSRQDTPCRYCPGESQLARLVLERIGLRLYAYTAWWIRKITESLTVAGRRHIRERIHF
jgi:hypothetical protein